MNHIQEICQLLQKWKEDRHLTDEQQQAGLITNLCEELGELAQARKQGDELSYIDALCDIFVFIANAHSFKNIDSLSELDDKLLQNLSDDITSDEQSIFASICDSIVTMYGILNKKPDSISLDILWTSCLGAIWTILQKAANIKRYDFFLCMKETIKEINSRTGSYNNTLGKWVKDTSSGAKAKWYKANYSFCKV